MKVWKLYRQGRSSLIPQNDLEESHWVDIDAAAFTPLWQAEADNVAQHPHVERFFLATGRLLPIWNLLGEDAQVRRLVTQGAAACSAASCQSMPSTHCSTSLALVQQSN